MKLLIAVPSEGNAEGVADGALRIVGRTGFRVKLFVPSNQRRAYRRAIADANYHWYLALTNELLESKLPPFTYALKNGYDLLLIFPDNVYKWGNDMDTEIADFVEKVGEARLKFASSPRKRIERLGRGVVMERVQ